MVFVVDMKQIAIQLNLVPDTIGWCDLYDCIAYKIQAHDDNFRNIDYMDTRWHIESFAIYYKRKMVRSAMHRAKRK